MKVKIVKAKLPTYWYANKIGEVYNVLTGPVEILGEMVYVTDAEESIVPVDDAEVVGE